MSERPGGALPPETGIGRVDLVVHDLARVEEFYRETLGLDALERRDGTVGYGVDEVLLRLTERPDLAPRPAAAAGLFHLAIRVPSRDDLAAVAARLTGGSRLDGASDHGVSEALYTRDPEGNGVEIYRDRPRADWPTSGDGVDMTTAPLDMDGLTSGVPADGAGGLPSGTDMGHIHLEVADLDRATAFYTDALGFTERDHRPGACFVAAGGYHHHVGLNTWNGRREPAQGLGSLVFSVEVPDAEAVDAAGDRLQRAGFAVDDADGVRLVADPDGIGVRIVAR